MLENLKEQVFHANLDLINNGLVFLTWGNASAIDLENQLVVIKPSGVSYQKMDINDMIVVDLEGKIVEGKLKPSSDTPTHLELYRSFVDIGGIVHTHSTYATAWAQAGKSIPIIGTTHADYFANDVPCTRYMADSEVFGDYELETGKSIVRVFEKLNTHEIPGVLVKNHGPFTWGKDVHQAVQNAIVLEEIAKIAHLSFLLNPNLTMNKALVKKHYDRKHGKDAYYGQK
jgi:L-ribulose-5-phosphate 4-epimerase